MKLLIAVLLCAFPISALGHPGKTDRYGGHKCVKGCEEWKLYYAEYHLHDKYGKPIRVAQNKKRAARIKSATTRTIDNAVLTEVPKTAQTVTVYKYLTVVNDKNVLSVNPLLWVLLILLLLLLILRLNRKRKV